MFHPVHEDVKKIGNLFGKNPYLIDNYITDIEEIPQVQTNTDMIMVGNLSPLYNSLPVFIEFSKNNAPRMTIFGATGSGKSVHKDTTVYIKIKNRIIRAKIKELPKYFERMKYIQTLTINPKTLRVEWKPIKAIIKHKANNLVKIRTLLGSELIITDDHSLLTIQNGRIIPSKCKIGLIIPRLRKLESIFNTSNSHIYTKNYLSIKVLDGSKLCSLVKEFRKHKFKSKERKKILKIIKEVTGWKNPYSFMNYLKSRPIKSRWLYSNKNGIKSKIKLDFDFGYFLGIYISEGYIDKTQNHMIYIFSHTNEIKEKIKSIKRILLKETIKAYKDKLVISNFLLSNFLKNTCGERSEKKKLPEFVFTANKKFISGLLSGLIDGDGCVNPRKCTISYTSKNRRLILQLHELLFNLGIFSKIRRRFNKKYNKNYWDIEILPISIPSFCSYLELQSPEKNRKIIKMLTIMKNRKRWSKFDMIYNFGYLLVELAKINGFYRRTSEFRNTLASQISTYTIRQKIGRSKLLKIINKCSQKIEVLTNLINSDIYWDKVTEIIPLDIEDDVYDIEVEGNHTFIANQIFVHNTTLVANIMFNAWLKGYKIISHFDIAFEYPDKICKVAEKYYNFSESDVREYILNFSPIFLKNPCERFQFDIDNLNLVDLATIFSVSDVHFTPLLDALQVIKRFAGKLNFEKLKTIVWNKNIFERITKGTVDSRTRKVLARQILKFESTNFFGKDQLNFKELFQNNCMLNFVYKDYGAWKNLANVYVAIQIRKFRRIIERYKRRTFSVFEEAHFLYPQRRILPSGKEIEESIRTTRKFKEGMILISQSHSDLNPLALEQSRYIFIPSTYDRKRISEIIKRLNLPYWVEIKFYELLAKAGYWYERYGIRPWFLIDKELNKVTRFFPLVV